MNNARNPVTLIAVVIFLAVAFTLTSPLLEATDNAPPAVGEIILNREYGYSANEVNADSDTDFGYAYQVPATWNRQGEDDNPGGRFTTYVSAPRTELSSNFTLSFTAWRAAKFMPVSEDADPYVDERAQATALDILPYLPEGRLTTVNSMPLLIRTEQDPTTPQHGPASYGTVMYFLVEDIVFHFWITYTPSAGAMREVEEAEWHTYNRIINTVAYSFSVDKNAPYFVNRPQPVSPEILRQQIEAELHQGPEAPPPTGIPLQGYPP